MRDRLFDEYEQFDIEPAFDDLEHREVARQANGYYSSPAYVRRLQSMLNQVMNLRLPVDGQMGPATRSAIRSYQQRLGLPVDGAASVGTRRMLMKTLTGLTQRSPLQLPSQPGKTVLRELESDYGSEDSSTILGELKSKLNTLTKVDSKVPGIKMVPVHPCKIKESGRKLVVRKAADITHVIIHTLGGRGRAEQAIENWKKGGGRNCSKPHYVVGRDGQISQVVAEHFIPRASNQFNNSSIAIEHGYLNAKFPDALLVSSAALVRDICNRYNIPKNRSRIIGHNEIDQSGCRKGGTGECHGDPGGYWDWDYYMALVNWDGKDEAVKPFYRIMDSREARNVNPKAKKILGKSKTHGNPLFTHSYSDDYFEINPSKTEEVFCSYKAKVPVEGDYSISAWWPIKIKGQHNPFVTFKIKVDSSIADPRRPRVITKFVNQTTLTGTTRKTFALPFTPQWQELANVSLKSGDVVEVTISRKSSSKGLIVADSIRLLCEKPKPQPFRPPDMCLAEELEWMVSDPYQEQVSQALPADLIETDSPTPCAFYRIKPGDNLVSVAAKAYGKSKCEGTFACAIKINEHPYNKQYWSSQLASNVFKGGRISFSPKFSGILEFPAKPTFQASKGSKFAVIYIPA